jgi:hypothetical protein
MDRRNLVFAMEDGSSVDGVKFSLGEGLSTFRSRQMAREFQDHYPWSEANQLTIYAAAARLPQYSSATDECIQKLLPGCSSRAEGVRVQSSASLASPIHLRHTAETGHKADSGVKG